MKNGTKFKVTFPKFKGDYLICVMENNNIKNTGQGSNLVSIIEKVSNNQKPIFWDRLENTIIVENNWFEVDRFILYYYR